MNIGKTIFGTSLTFACAALGGITGCSAGYRVSGPPKPGTWTVADPAICR